MSDRELQALWKCNDAIARLSVGGAGDLYAFRGNRLGERLAAETDCVLDLASREYSRAVEPHLPPGVRGLQRTRQQERVPRYKPYLGTRSYRITITAAAKMRWHLISAEVDEDRKRVCLQEKHQVCRSHCHADRYLWLNGVKGEVDRFDDLAYNLT